MDSGQNKPDYGRRGCANAGLDVKFVAGANGGLQHAKFMIVDGSTLAMGSKQTKPELFQIMQDKLVVLDDRVFVVGSGNLSGSAFFNNFEFYVRLTRPDVVGAAAGRGRALRRRADPRARARPHGLERARVRPPLNRPGSAPPRSQKAQHDDEPERRHGRALRRPAAAAPVVRAAIDVDTRLRTARAAVVLAAAVVLGRGRALVGLVAAGDVARGLVAAAAVLARGGIDPDVDLAIGRLRHVARVVVADRSGEARQRPGLAALAPRAAAAPGSSGNPEHANSGSSRRRSRNTADVDARFALDELDILGDDG